MSDKLRVGVIGCGSIAAFHVQGYLACGRYEVVALADLSTEAMADFDTKFIEHDGYSAKHYTDAAEMLDTEGLDVVSVCVWHRGHAKWTIEAAARKPRAILCEKPMAEDMGRADEMLVACRRNGVKLAIGHQRRFLPSYTEARSLIASGAIGEVQLMRSISGAGLLNWGTHLFDMFRYILGDAECRFVMGAVERQTDRHERTTRIEDVAMGAFEFDGGIDALILSDFAPEYYQGCMVYGSEGTIDLQTSYYGLLSRQTGGAMERRAPNGRFFDADHDAFEWHEGPASQADELADWIEGERDDYRGDAVNGYRSLEMALAVYESARLHERIELPLRTRSAPLDLMIESGHLPVRYPGKYDIRNIQLRGTNMSSDEDNT